MLSDFNIVEIFLVLVFGGIGIYVILRLVFHAWFSSKLEFIQRIRGVGNGKENHEE